MAELEEKRKERLRSFVIAIQSHIRAYHARNLLLRYRIEYERKVKAATAIQKALERLLYINLLSNARL